MTEYVSIKADVLKKLEENLPEIRKRFGIETLGVFGSVARGEDMPESDIDILVTFLPESDKYMNFLHLSEYLEALLGRNVDLLTERSISVFIKPYIHADMITYTCAGIV